tara:strand:+ start:199 stop:375 length:177 start_codon:yes stop_codon:yes gene_type:complete
MLLAQWKNLRVKINKHTDITQISGYSSSFTKEEYELFLALQIEITEAELLQLDDRWGI